MPDATPAGVEQHPHLILTLRRTGGTSLMSFLSLISAFGTVEHEPFNKERIWRALTDDFEGRYDSAAFAAALDSALTKRPNIKHCFEIVPLALTKALIEACVARGYRVLVLTRRNEVGRLRSLFVAQITGVWGQTEALKKYPAILSGETVLAPVEIGSLRHRAKLDATFLASVRAMLEDAGISHEELVFEDIYADEAELRVRACAIAAKLGVQVAQDDPRLAELAKGQGLSASQVVKFIPNLSEFEAELKRMADSQAEAAAQS